MKTFNELLSFSPGPHGTPITLTPEFARELFQVLTELEEIACLMYVGDYTSEDAKILDRLESMRQKHLKDIFIEKK